ncbi:cation diffusion facilitator family transporter [Pusillimonas sp. TS35]|nr:cation diffusion facilitator family transporter [Pusillimonas sp. TS35]
MATITPRQALLLSLFAALATIGMKAAAWWITGSVGYLSDALESLVNLAGASFALAMLTYARRPPDHDHPFGHGKAEYFSAAFEGGMIFLAALAILVTAGQRLFHLQPVEGLGMGTLLSVVASVVNLLAARILMTVGLRHRSVALIADARHLMTDVWTTAGVIVGVGLAVVTGLQWLDPVVAILVALNILREGGSLLRRSVSGMMDQALDDDIVARLETLLRARIGEGCTVANLRTRAAGATQFAQVDLRVPGDWSVRKAHDLADALEDAAAAHDIVLTTHVEPNDQRERVTRP